METTAQALSNQTSLEGVASVLTETMVRDFECMQASVHLLDLDKQELLRTTQMGLAEVTPPEREKLGANLTGRTVSKLLQEPSLADIDLEPETEPCVSVKGVALACPLVASLNVLGVLHIVLPENLARYYMYNRVPMTDGRQSQASARSWCTGLYRQTLSDRSIGQSHPREFAPS
jgi:hypothetical protein